MNLRAAALAFLLLAASVARAGDLHLTEVGTNGTVLCDGWASFHRAWFINPHAGAIRVKAIRTRISSAQELRGEYGVWISSMNGMVYSYGASAFTGPSQSLQDFTKFSPDYIEMQMNDSWQVEFNCGPVTGQPHGFYYAGVVQIYWEKR